jgi:WD40 repeat protein
MSDSKAVHRLKSLWQLEGGEHINTLVWSPDNTRIAAAYADGSVAVYDTVDGHEVWRHTVHGLSTSALAWSPDGRLLASGGQRGGIILWDPATGSKVHQLDSGRSWVEFLCWSDRHGLASAAGRQIQLWSSEGELKQTFDQVGSTVTGLLWLADNTLLSSCYGLVNQWSTERKQSLQQFPWKDSLLSLSVSPDQRFIAAGCQDNAIHLWYLKSGEDFRMSGYPSKVRHFNWSADSRYFATGGAESLIIWDCSGDGPQNRQPVVLPVHSKPISAVVFSHANSRVASGGEDGLTVVFDLARAEPLAGLLDEAGVSTLVWSQDDKALAIGYRSGRLRLCRMPPER